MRWPIEELVKSRLAPFVKSNLKVSCKMQARFDMG